MKTAKKVLGIVVVLAMLLNVFALGVFAAYPEDTAIKLIIAPEKSTYAAGEDITFIVSAMGNADLGGLSPAGQYEIGFNSTALEPYSTTSDKATDHGIEVTENQTSGVSLTDSVIAVPSVYESMSYLDDTAASKGWDTLMMYGISSNGGTYVYEDASTTPVVLFKFKMKVKADAPDGTYNIGFNKTGYGEMWSCYMGCENYGDVYGLHGSDTGLDSYAYTYEFGSCEFSVGAGKIIFHEKAQHNTAATTAEKATLGFVGEFDSTDIGGFVFKEGSNKTLANVTAVGVILDVEGLVLEDNTFKTDTVYTKGGTEYNFRAILENLPLAQYGDAKITVTYFIEYLKDGTPTTEYSDTEEFTANGIIND